MTSHPKGSGARILLSSVFGPYAQDDQYGSRKINPMELYHNQVTREQGPFSLRMFHRSWGILMIQKNISAPTTVLDFPTREAFEKGISISGIFAQAVIIRRALKHMDPWKSVDEVRFADRAVPAREVERAVSQAVKAVRKSRRGR